MKKLRFLKDQPRASVGDEFFAGKEQAEYLVKHKIAEIVDEKTDKIAIEGKDTREVVQPSEQYVAKNVEPEKVKDPEEAKPVKPVDPKPAK